MLQLQKIKTVTNNIIVFCAVALSTFCLTYTASADFVMPVTPVGAPGNFDSAILNMTNWILGFVGAIAVLALIWGGINYVTAAGSEDQARTAKQTIKYALLGLIVAGIAWALVNVVVTTILG